MAHTCLCLSGILRKPPKNRRKHGISFEAASAVLEDPFALEEQDSVVEGEERLRAIGAAGGEVIVIVIYTMQMVDGGLDELARIISARKASPQERQDYERNRAASGWNSVE